MHQPVDLNKFYSYLSAIGPIELVFDVWLEMPINYDSSIFARDFYLDIEQRNTLDRIQRCIIEPLKETIAIFGTILPPLQFDPIIEYFEQQFQSFAASKDVTEFRTLSTLAEIALRRPHLLAPSPIFRDLFPQQKIAYLDALEVALQTIKQSKEIEELKALVQTLWHYPTEDGWRAESFKQERVWHQQLMRLISEEIPAPASKTLSFVQDTGIKHYALKPEIISQFLIGCSLRLMLNKPINFTHAAKSAVRSGKEIIIAKRNDVFEIFYKKRIDGDIDSFNCNNELKELLLSLNFSGELLLKQENSEKLYKQVYQEVTSNGGCTFDWQPKDAEITGNHLVYRIMNASKTETLCWAKVFPEQPGIEWLMLHLDRRLGVYGIPCSTLVNLHHNRRNTAVLLSQHVPHPNLLETLQTTPQALSNLDRAHFFKTLMRVLLSNPEDDKGDDYFLEPQTDGKLKLIRIDNERAFFAPESVGGIWKVRKLRVKSIIYCLDLLTESLKNDIPNPSIDAAVQDFLQLEPYALLKNLFLELKALQPLWQALFSKLDIERHYHNTKPWLSLPILYVPKELVKELSVRMESLQLLLDLTPQFTGLELFKAIQPILAKHYLQGFKQYQSRQPYSTVLARFAASPGQHYTVQGQNTLSLRGTEAATLSLRLATSLSLDIVKDIWEGKAYAADSVLSEIENWEVDHSKKIYEGLVHSNSAIQKEARAGWRRLPNRQRALIFNDFSNRVRGNSEANIFLQQSILSILPGTTFLTLDLSVFHVSLDDELLIPILKTEGAHLITLNLNGCRKLSETIPAYISMYCPNLKTLNVCSMAWKSFSTGLRGWSPVLLPTIKNLELQDCEFLQYFIVEAPQAKINLRGCTALGYMQLSPHPFASSTQQLGECQHQLAKAYLLGAGLIRNPDQAYYWARLARACQHPLNAILCHALFNFYAVKPFGGANESLAAERTTKSLVGESLFVFIQAKKPDVKTLKVENVNLNTAKLTLLSLSLAANNTLQNLELIGNVKILELALDETGNKNVEELAQALKWNYTLECLDLDQNNISVPGVMALVEMLKVNSTLQYLSISNNNIGVTGAKLLAEALKVNFALQHLNLSGALFKEATIDATGAQALAGALKVNTTLRSLYLSKQAIGVAGAKALNEALEGNSTLQSLGHLESGNKLHGGEGQRILNQINESLARNQQNTQNRIFFQLSLYQKKFLEKRDDAVLGGPLTARRINVE